MNENITNLDLVDFLTDYRCNSDLSLLEESKEKNELIEIAKAKGIDLKNNSDLAGFKSVYTFANKANRNGARMPKEKLLKALPTIIGKPVDVDHVRTHVVGHYIDYRYNAEADSVTAFGVFYKSNFADLWDEAKKLVEAKKLTTSYECWTPKDKRTKLADGTYNLNQIELAGGALLFRETPAFSDAKVLEVAKVNTETNEALVCAKYTTEDLIVSEVSVPTVETKVTCSNCKQELDYTKIPETCMGAVKCPNCLSIIDQTGKVLFPPQVIDFRISCPECSSSNWLIKENKESSSVVQCRNCTKDYEISFKKNVKLLADDFEFLYSGNVACKQCGSSIVVSGISSIKSREVKCHKCGLEFSFTIGKEKYRTISKIDKVKEMIKSSEEGGKNIMDFELEVSKCSRRIRRSRPDATPGALGAVLDEEMNKWCDEREMEHEYDDMAEEAKKLSYQEKKALPDKDFALVMRVKNQNTGKIRKIRKYAINDENHVRNALARLGQEPSKKGLEALGVSVEKVRAKVAKKAKAMGIEVASTEPKVVETVQPSVAPEVPVVAAEVVAVVEPKVEEKPVEVASVVAPEVVATVVEAAAVVPVQSREEVMLIGLKRMAKKYAELLKSSKEQVAFYQANAQTVITRRATLGELAVAMVDADLMNDDKYARVLAEKELALVKAKLENQTPDLVGSKVDEAERFARLRKAIDDKAQGKVKRDR